MTLPEANELLDYWRDHPPVHVMVAAYLQIKPRAAKAEYLPMVKISKTLGAAEPEIVKSAAPINDNAHLAALAKRTGGEISLEQLVGRTAGSAVRRHDRRRPTRPALAPEPLSKGRACGSLRGAHPRQRARRPP